MNVNCRCEEYIGNIVGNKPTPPDDLWDQLDKIVDKELPSRPVNSVTVREFTIRKGCNRDKARRQLEELVLRGKMRKTLIEGVGYYTIV